MRAVLCVVLVSLALLCAVEAKLVSVTGQGVILGPSNLPANLYDNDGDPAHPDSPSALLNGQHVVTAFDEKQSHVLSTPITIGGTDMPAVILQAGVPYDSHFVFFHQPRGSPGQISANATFTIDNRFVGCTETTAQEFQTSAIFGLPQVLYPTVVDTVRTSAGRTFEFSNMIDGVIGAGTRFDATLRITQPGDYTRCFSATCVDSNGGACACSVNTANLCISPPSNNYHCFADAAAIVNNPNFVFSSTCAVDKSSIIATVDSCDAANGCKINSAGHICLQALARGSFVNLHVTAGCGCDTGVRATFTATSNPNPNCVPATEVLDPPTPTTCTGPCDNTASPCSAASAQAVSSGTCASLSFTC